MKSDYVLIGSVLLLAMGLGFIFGYTHGTVGFRAALPVSGTSLQVWINMTGLPALVGVPPLLVLAGLLLLIVAVILAIIRQVPGAAKA